MSNEIRFTKMQGIGNDYIYVDCFRERVENPPAVSQYLSDRHFGVGSDGLVLILPSDQGRPEDGYFTMRMFNADGSEAEMCGNAIRCVAKFVFEKELTKKKVVRVATLSGEKVLILNTDGDRVISVRVDMGEPVFRSKEIPVNVSTEEAMNVAIEALGEKLQFSAVSVGNPHAVFFVPEITDHQILRLGPTIECDPLFPKKINVEFAQVLSRDLLRMRVWERGSGETLACGTGACAVALVSAKLGQTNRHCKVELRGGTLEILWADAALAREHKLIENHFYMTGPAEFVFEGVAVLPGDINV